MAKLIACAGQGVELSGVPTEIKILPLGRVHSQKGDFNVDDESFELIRKQFKDRKLDLVIDYEHQTLSDVQAPAGGWIKDLYKGEDAIIAKVEWTPKAAEYLKNMSTDTSPRWYWCEKETKRQQQYTLLHLQTHLLLMGCLH